MTRSLSTRWLRWLGRAELATRLMAVWKLARHPATPLLPRYLAWAILAYAASPIDLIPDFIPVLGQLDDLILIPLGVMLVVRLTPRPLWEACWSEAKVQAQALPRWRWAALLVIGIWLLLALGFALWLLHVVGVAW